MDDATKDGLIVGLDSVVAHARMASTAANDATNTVGENSELAPALRSVSQAFEHQLSAFVQLTSILQRAIEVS